MRFKIFKCDDASSSYSYDYLQSDIDEWLNENEGKIEVYNCDTKPCAYKTNNRERITIIITITYRKLVIPYEQLR